MLENLDPVILARIQFAFTVSFHIFFQHLPSVWRAGWRWSNGAT